MIYDACPSGARFVGFLATVRYFLIVLLILGAPVPGSTAGAAPAVNATAAPARDTAQRRAILNALRPAVEAQIGPELPIQVVQGWAFVSADPQRRGGRAIDGHRYFPYFYEMGGLRTTAILRF